MTYTDTATRPTESVRSPETDPTAVTSPSGHIGRVVVGSMLGGLFAAIVLVFGPLAGRPEHVITSSTLLAFAAAWAALAHLSTRRTDQPQRWAFAPAVAMAVAGLTVLVLAPTGNELGWLWPPAMVALVAWMVRRSRRDLRSKTRAFVLYPVFAALALSAVGGAYETYRESTDPTAEAMPGRMVGVGDRSLHISCTGHGSPVVVLEAGLGEGSPMMASWLAPDVAPTSRVCVYDRAGRDWSEAADAPQDGQQVASDLHRLLHNAGEFGPYVLAGHSTGGVYVINFAKRYPQDVAGVVLLDAMHPEQYDRIPAWPGFYEMFRRASAVMPTLARLGVGRLAYQSQYSDMPAAQRDAERAFLASPRYQRSVRDEFSKIRVAMNQAAELKTLGDMPLVVVTAKRDAEPGWFSAQDDLATLSTNSLHRTLPNATHQMLVEDEDAARNASQAIVDVVTAVRTGSRLNGQEG